MDFIIAVLGLVQGMRLVRDGWTHLNRAAVETGKLADLSCSVPECEHVLTQAMGWWTSVTPEVQKLMFGAVHWRVFGSTYSHDFEKFSAQYSVLDSLFAAHCEINGIPRKVVGHTERLTFLVNKYSVLDPSWANLKKRRIADLRNELVHEAKFGGAPIGFAHPQDVPQIAMELEAFNTRLILAMLGVNCGYTRSPCDTRQMHGLELP